MLFSSLASPPLPVPLPLPSPARLGILAPRSHPTGHLTITAHPSYTSTIRTTPHTAWMPQPCRSRSMNAAFLSYAPGKRPREARTTRHNSLPKAQKHQKSGPRYPLMINLPGRPRARTTRTRHPRGASRRRPEIAGPKRAILQR